MEFEYTHTLTTPDARQRLEALGQYLAARHNIDVSWNGDRALFHGKFKKLVKIHGEMTFTNGKVSFVGHDPGRVWRGQAIKYIQRKLEAYLDPSVALHDLPRS